MIDSTKLDSSKLNRNSLAQAYLILIPFINAVFGFMEVNSAMITNIAICSAIIVFSIRDYHFSYTLSFILYIISIVCMYNLSIHTVLDVKEFIFGFAFASFIGTGTYNCERTLKYVTYASLLVLPFWRELFLRNSSVIYTNESVTMSVAYALLPIIIAGMLHFAYFRDKANIVLRICYALDIVILFQLFLRANRGFIVSICVAIILIYIKGRIKQQISNAAIFKIIIISAICLLVIINIDIVLESLSNLLKKLGYSANFIEKTERLSSDVTNGRNYIYTYTIENILKSPLWGHGICTMLYNSGGNIIYPHNFILQSLYDGGVILFVIIIIPLCKIIKDIFNRDFWERGIYSLFLFLICVPKMLFTSDMWTNATFFMMLSYSMTYVTNNK